MEIHIFAQGPGFTISANLKAAVLILEGLGDSFDFCLKKSFVYYNIPSGIEPSSLNLVRARPGSLDIQLITQVAAAVAPLAPGIFGYAWTLYKSGYDLVQLAVKYFRKEERPLTISITDSPGAYVNLVLGNQIATTKDAYDTALKYHKNLDRIASVVRDEIAERVTIEPEQPDLPGPVKFDHSNKNDFKVQSAQRTDDSPVTFECTIIRFHKKTLNGILEIQEEGILRFHNFTIPSSLLEECIRAFGDPAVKVSALREFEINALGESKIKTFHIVSIHPI